MGFSFPGGLIPRSGSGKPRYPTLERYGSSFERRLYSRYGGFGRRKTGAEPADVFTLFERRHELIQATSLNAPIHRARIEHGTDGIGLPWSDAGLRFGLPEIPAPSAELQGLGERLEAGISVSHARVSSEAWAWFRRGNEDSSNYRRAARAFESAVMLDNQDVESRIGELFSVLSVGAYRTAIVLLSEIAKRDSAPFTHALDLGEMYGDPLQARQVRMLCESFAQASEGAGAAVALQAFVLWYVGDREQAILTAEPLAVKHPNTNFADWATQMRIALPMRESTAEDR